MASPIHKAPNKVLRLLSADTSQAVDPLLHQRQVIGIYDALDGLVASAFNVVQNLTVIPSSSLLAYTTVAVNTTALPQQRTLNFNGTDFAVADDVIFSSTDVNLATTGVAAASYGDSTHVGAFTVDTKGRLSAASSVLISGASLAITQLTGDVLAGPGVGSQVATLVNIPNDTNVAGDLSAVAIAAPATPAAGKARVYVDSTTKTLYSKDDAGRVTTTVAPRTAVATFFVTSMSTSGTLGAQQPAFSDLFGTLAGSQFGPLSGDVVTSLYVATIQPNVVTNAKLAQMAAHTYKGNSTGALANASDVPAATVLTDIGAQPLISLTSGSVVFSGGGSTLSQNNAGFFWNNGTAQLGSTGATSFDIMTASTSRISVSATGRTTVSGGGTSGGEIALAVNPGANTNVNSDIASISLLSNNAVGLSAGATLATMSAIQVFGHSYNAPSARTITTASTLTLTQTPTAGANVTITQSLCLWVKGGDQRTTGNVIVDTLTGGTSEIVKASTTGVLQRAVAGTDYMAPPSLTSGSVVFSGGGSVLSQDNANFFWDNTNKRLGTTGATAFVIQTNSAPRTTWSATGGIATSQANVVGGETALAITPGSHTAIAGEVTDVAFNISGAVSLAAGATIPTMRNITMFPRTYTAPSARTITTAATLAIQFAPAPGTNVTMTQTLALWIQSGDSRFGGNIIGDTLTGGTSAILKASTTGVIQRATAGTDYFSGPLTGDVTTVGVAGTVTTLANIPTATPAAGYIQFTDIASPGSPASGKTRVWTGGFLKAQDNLGSLSTTAAGFTAVANQFLTSFSNVTATFTAAQPSFSNLSGTATTAQLPYSLTSGSVVFSGGGAVLSQNNNNFFWDDTNKRLVLAKGSAFTPAAGAPLTIYDTSGVQIAISIAATTSQQIDKPGTGDLFIGVSDAAANLKLYTNIGTSATWGPTGTLTQAWRTNIATGAKVGGDYALRVTPGAHTAVGPSELPDVNFSLGRTVAWSLAGTVAAQRAFLVEPPTYSGAGTTITNVATVGISGPPVAGASMTFTNKWTLWSQAGTARFDAASGGKSASFSDAGANSTLNIDHVATSTSRIMTAAGETLQLGNGTSVQIALSTAGSVNLPAYAGSTQAALEVTTAGAVVAVTPKRLVKIQVFTTTGAATYNRTVGANLAIFELTGGGGGAAGLAATAASQTCASAGGGGGAFARCIWGPTSVNASLPALPVSMTLQIGTAGAAGASGGAAAGAGTASSVTDGTNSVTAGAGAGSNSLSPASNGGTFVFASGGGAVTTTGSPVVTDSVFGGNGGPAQKLSTSAFAVASGNSIAGNGGAPGADGGVNFSASGVAGLSAGCGGNGHIKLASTAASAGAAGLKGQIIVYEYAV